MHVLHLVPAEPFGGAQSYAVTLAAAQRGAGMDARLLSLRSGEVLRRAADGAGLPIEAVEGRALSRLRRVSRRLATFSVDVVHLHVAPAWIALCLPRQPRFALIAHLHVRPALINHAPTLRRRLEKRLDERLLQRSDRVVGVSDWVAAEWRKLHPRMPTPLTVANGVNLSGPNSDVARAQGSVLGAAVRLADRRGVEQLLELVHTMRARGSTCRMEIAGDGPMADDYRASAAPLGDAVAFAGFQADVGAFWRRLDVAVYTAPLDTFGLRLIEPVAHGVPVIAFRNNTGSDEVIERCRGIAAVPYGDVGALADLAERLLTNPGERARMAREGREDLHAHFSMERLEREMRAVYEDALRWSTR